MMTESDAVTRINAAIGRIEAAIARQGQETDALRARHAALRGEVAQAIAAIDELVDASAGEDAG